MTRRSYPLRSAGFLYDFRIIGAAAHNRIPMARYNPAINDYERSHYKHREVKLCQTCTDRESPLEHHCRDCGAKLCAHFVVFDGRTPGARCGRCFYASGDAAPVRRLSVLDAARVIRALRRPRTPKTPRGFVSRLDRRPVAALA